MTHLNALIERARAAQVNRAHADRYLRELEPHLARPAAGDAMGSYEIVRQIGEGGMGVVYLGTHAILGRPAAIKVLLPELSPNRNIVRRFFNEARAAASIRHPGIVDIYDFGFLADGAAYIAMEFLEGETLRARLRRQGRLPARAAIQIGRQIAAALHAAHDKGITHRDLKPDNIFLVPDPEIGERIKLLDFGIAKLADKDDASPHTRTGVVLGTPVYMSPEQCRGLSTLDSRSDLYSLGCILYELLAGRPVFDVSSANDVVAHHMHFPPEPVRSHAPSVPELLDGLIASLLRKDPAMRPATAGEVFAILERCRTSVSMPVVDEPSAPVSIAVPAAPVAPVPAVPVPAAPVPIAAAPLAAVPTPVTALERRSGGVSTTLGGAAGAVSGDISVLAGRRHGRRTVWLVGAALAAAAGIAITAGWPRVSPPAATPAVAPTAPEPVGAHPAPSMPAVAPSTEIVAPPDAVAAPPPAAALPPPPAAALPPPLAIPAQSAAPPMTRPATSPPPATVTSAPTASTAPARTAATPAHTPATKPKKLDRARPVTPVAPSVEPPPVEPPPVAPQPVSPPPVSSPPAASPPPVSSPPVPPEPRPRSEEEILTPRK